MLGVGRGGKQWTAPRLGAAIWFLTTGRGVGRMVGYGLPLPRIRTDSILQMRRKE